MKWFALLFCFFCGLAAPALAGPSELALALQAADPGLLKKGVSIRPLGMIHAGKRTFWIAQATWYQPPENIIGAPHGACVLMVLERKKERLTFLGQYSNVDCEYPLSVQKNRIVAGYPKWAEPEYETRSFTIGEKGPKERIIFGGRECWFGK